MDWSTYVYELTEFYQSDLGFIHAQILQLPLILIRNYGLFAAYPTRPFFLLAANRGVI